MSREQVCHIGSEPIAPEKNGNTFKALTCAWVTISNVKNSDMVSGRVARPPDRVPAFEFGYRGTGPVKAPVPPGVRQTARPAECLQAMNNEITTHISKWDINQKPDITKLGDQHSFDVNLRLISESLADHIEKSISSIRIRRKDLFISLYSYDPSVHLLTYELHFDPRRDFVKSRSIDLDKAEFENYECVKCMASSNSTAYVLNKKDYEKGSADRHKTVSQYMGCKLENGIHIYGFLNIEFHNHHIFVDEEEMRDFMEENIFPFKLLLEYQYLKREFFRRFENLNHNEGGA